MALSLRRYALICAGLFIGAALYAQSFSTHGLPWTYVPQDQVPAYAVDTAQDRVVLNYPSQIGAYRDLEVRHLYRIHLHPLLTELDSLGRITIELPRNPGESELVLVDSGRVTEQIALVGNDTIHSGYSVGGFRSNQATQLNLIQVRVLIIDKINFNGSPDSTATGEIGLGPKTYAIHPNFLGDADAWAYFIQFVDSVWHPPLVSDVEEMVLPHGAEQLSVYPNPALSGSMLNVTIPSGWSNDAVSLRLYDPTGRRVLFARRDPRDTHELELPQGCAAGVYTLTAYRLGGELAVGRVVVR